MIIRGDNLGEVEVSFKKISSWEYKANSEILSKELLERIEKIYVEAYKESQETDVKKMEQNDDEVILKQGMITHQCSSNIDSLRMISKLGILASEWFGKIESEAEGTFCAFLDRIHEEGENDYR